MFVFPVIAVCIYSFNENRENQLTNWQPNTRHRKDLNKNQICRDCSVKVTTFSQDMLAATRGKTWICELFPRILFICLNGFLFRRTLMLWRSVCWSFCWMSAEAARNASTVCLTCFSVFFRWCCFFPLWCLSVVICLHLDIYSIVPLHMSVIHSFIPNISIVLLQVHYFSEALPTTALVLCWS